MRNTNWYKIFIWSKSAKQFAEYMGGANFLNGSRVCPRCKGNMERYPLGQSYIRTENGKVLVDITGNEGRMVVSNATPHYLWGCLSCKTAITPKQQKPLK